jgi:hypothetical protein
LSALPLSPELTRGNIGLRARAGLKVTIDLDPRLTSAAGWRSFLGVVRLDDEAESHLHRRRRVVSLRDPVDEAGLGAVHHRQPTATLSARRPFTDRHQRVTRDALGRHQRLYPVRHEREIRLYHGNRA